MDGLSWQEKEVGVIFGFMKQLLSLAKIFKSNDLVFTWDSRQSIRTKMLFPAYKETRKREKTPEEKMFDDDAYRQFDIIRKEIIPTLGFKNNFMIDGYEADDLMAEIVFSNPNKTIVIISTDEDLYQLLSDDVTMYSIRKKQTYTNINLWKEFRITPEEWGEVKSISGCSTDSIPGVPNVGEKTACKYITKKLDKNTKTYRAIKESKELIDRNKKLIILPLKGTPSITLLPKINDTLQIKNFITICQRYGFNSFTEGNALIDWKKYIFKG
jgi:DNA polymerase-1